MLALIRALAAGGGSITPGDAYEWIRSNTDLAGKMPSVTKLSASEHFEREIRFGRQELAESGFVATVHGSWRLLDADAVHMNAEQAREITRQNTRRRRAEKSVDTDAKTKRVPSPRAPQPTTGPRPTGWQGSVTREIGPASTYLFQFEGSSVWKVGFAANVEARLREVNRHVPVELLDRRWLLVRSQPWTSSELAYRMEQLILELLALNRTVYERVECDADDIDVAWSRALRDVSVIKAP